MAAGGSGRSDAKKVVFASVLRAETATVACGIEFGSEAQGAGVYIRRSLGHWLFLFFALLLFVLSDYRGCDLGVSSWLSSCFDCADGACASSSTSRASAHCTLTCAISL